MAAPLKFTLSHADAGVRYERSEEAHQQVQKNPEQTERYFFAYHYQLHSMRHLEHLTNLG
jgi:hypothetical protein